MGINATSLAAGVGAAAKNVQFQAGATNLPRKICLLASYDPAKNTVVANAPVLVLSPEDAGYQFGFGFMAHRLAVQAFKGGNGIPTYVLPIAEAGGAAWATGSVDFTGSAGVLAGTLYAYIAGIPVSVPISAGMTPIQIATAFATKILADKTLPVTASAGGTPVVTIDAKSKGPWGNSISIKFNLGYGQALPTGVVAAVTAMASGAGVPDVAAALAAIGSGDSANEAYFTDVVNGFGTDTTTLDAISTYVGAGNELVGLYSNTVSRPFRCLSGDVGSGSGGLTTLISLADGRKLDRANGVIAVPDSASHPAEIAAQAMGHLARISQDRAAQSPVGVPLIDIHPGAKANRWTNSYDSRDTAVKSGISPTRVQNGVVVLQNVVTFYRPDNVPVDSNGYRSMRNIAILQNLLYNIRLNFEQEKWQGCSIVADTARVTNTMDRLKARDVDSVINDLILLAKSFAAHAWLYEAGFTINELKKPGAVTIRPGGTGFNSILSVILSGEAGVLDTLVQFDTSLAVLTQ